MSSTASSPPVSYDAFVSYASADLVMAQAVHDRLTAAGFRVWFDRDRLKPGFNWHREIEAGCEASAVMLPVLTPRWRQSLWTCYETYAHDAIIPLRFEGSIDEVLTPPLRRYQADSIDFTHIADHDWDRLIAALRMKLDKLKADPPDRLPRIASLRYPRNPYFVGRESVMNEMLEKLFVNPTTAITQGRVQAVTAHGGVGKTTLASEFAQRFWRLYRQIFWVDCRLGLDPEFANIAVALFGEEKLKGVSVPDRAAMALRTLNQPLERDLRLLILDNADDEAALTVRNDQGHIAVNWIPEAGSCHTVITSRFTAWSDAVQKTELYVLDPKDAWALLAGRSGTAYESLPETEQAACRSLADRLGYLPLALEVAAAYIKLEGPGFGFADYLAYYSRSQKRALQDHSHGFTKYPESVYTTWRITIDRLKPGSRALLRLCAWFAPTPIPLAMFLDQGKQIAELGQVVTGQPPEEINPNQYVVREWKRQLTDYSLATPGPSLPTGSQSIVVHALTQSVERHSMSPEQTSTSLSAANACFWDYAPGGHPQTEISGWPVWATLAGHVVVLAEHLVKHGDASEAARLLNNCGQYLDSQARLSEAEPLMRRVVTIYEDGFGNDHPNVAAALNNLAALLQATNRLIEAELLMRRALAIGEGSFGNDHPNVAAALNNLAALLQATNRLAEAEPLMVRALAIDEASYGKDHPNVAIRLNNLAALLQDTNRLTEAEPLMRRVVETVMAFTHATGHPHPHLQTAINNYGSMLMEMGKTRDEAIAAVREICPEMFASG